MDRSQFARPAHEILSPRLVLRTPTMADVDVYYRLLVEPANFPFDQRDMDMTPDKARAKIQLITERTVAGRTGPLVFALRDTGELIGYGGYNVFQNVDPAVYLGHASEQAAGSDSSALPSQGQYLADIGVMIDHNQWRKGFGLEALSALIEYAQVELGCGLFRIETDLANKPFRSLMRAAALGAYESVHRATYDKDLDVRVWKFGAVDWTQARETTKATGKWPL